MMNFRKLKTNHENEEATNDIEHNKITADDNTLENELLKNNSESADKETIISNVINELFDYFTSPNKTYLSQLNTGQITKEQFEEEAINQLNIITAYKKLTDEDKQIILSRFLKSLWGYEKIDTLINDDDVSDIKILSYDNIRIKKKGVRQSSNIKFKNKEEYIRFVNLIASKNHVNLGIKNAIKYFTDKYSSDRAILRFNITTDFVNSNEQPCVHIRKTLKNKKEFDTLIEEGLLTIEEKDYLMDKIVNASGIVFTGKGSSGKTTVMNACLTEIPKTNSVCIIQENDELFDNNHPEMDVKHVVMNKGESAVQYTLKDLSINGLLTDIDYFIIGEIKGAEAAYFLNAAYTGNKCWCSVHGVNSQEALDKLCDYVTYDTRYSKDEIMKMLRFMNVIVFMKDYKIAEITEVTGYDAEKKQLIYKPIFKNGMKIG